MDGTGTCVDCGGEGPSVLGSLLGLGRQCEIRTYRVINSLSLPLSHTLSAMCEMYLCICVCMYT